MRHGQAEAVLVAYDIIEVAGQDVRPEALEERRKRLAKLLSRSNKAMREGIQLSETITGDGAAIFRHACGMGLEGIVSNVSARAMSAAERSERGGSSAPDTARTLVLPVRHPNPGST